MLNAARERNLFTIKIDSQRQTPSLDWRRDFNGLPPCEEHVLDSAEQEKIERFIRRSGLRYGSIDVVVDERGRHVFLEVNETGQFLWLEALLPDIPLLDCFTDFLMHRDPEFNYSRRTPRVRAGDYDEFLQPAALADRQHGHAKIINQARIFE